MPEIKITAGPVQEFAELNDTPCAKAIWDALPIRARASTWGDEIYFGIDVSCDVRHPQSTVGLGDLGYWPDGSCFCIFFGPTPMSRGSEIRPASPVEVFGRLLGNPKDFARVGSGEPIIIERAD